MRLPGAAGGGGGGKFRKVRTWGSFVMALIGSAILAITPVGLWVADRTPGVVAAILLALAITVAFCDIGSDGEPNWWAVRAALTAPILALGTNGQLSALVGDMAAEIRAQAGSTMGDWIGLAGAALGGTLVAMAFVAGQGTLKRGR